MTFYKMPYRKVSLRDGQPSKFTITWVAGTANKDNILSFSSPLFQPRLSTVTHLGKSCIYRSSPERQRDMESAERTGTIGVSLNFSTKNANIRIIPTTFLEEGEKTD